MLTALRNLAALFVACLALFAPAARAQVFVSPAGPPGPSIRPIVLDPPPAGATTVDIYLDLQCQPTFRVENVMPFSQHVVADVRLSFVEDYFIDPTLPPVSSRIYTGALLVGDPILHAHSGAVDLAPFDGLADFAGSSSAGIYCNWATSQAHITVPVSAIQGNTLWFRMRERVGFRPPPGTVGSFSDSVQGIALVVYQ
jgi:hypothetical protein